MLPIELSFQKMAERVTFIWIFFLSSISVCVAGSNGRGINFTSITVQELSSGSRTSTKKGDYCIKGESSISPSRIWSTIEVKLNFNTEGCQLFQAESLEDLQKAQNPTWAKSFLSYVAKTDYNISNFTLSPFKYSCFNIETPKNLSNYEINLTLKKFHWAFPLSLVFGLVLFLHAESLSRSATFYYSSGIVLGIGVSLLLVVFLLHRVVPSRAGAYTLLAGGWSFSLYFLQWSWNNLLDLVLERNPVVVGYFILAGLISFGLCYYNGPVTNERGINLIKWTIQLISTYFIYKGVQPQTLSVAVIAIIYAYSFLTSTFIQKVLNLLPQNIVSYRVQYYLFPPKTQLLTDEEYEAEGITETHKALMELRQYCSSPDCNAWKVISRIRNPKRLSDFVTEGAHITEEEYNIFEEDSFEYPKDTEDDNDE